MLYVNKQLTFIILTNFKNCPMKEQTPFEKEFYSLCQLLGENSTVLIESFGQYDDIDENERRTFVCYKNNYSFFGIINNQIDSIQIPVIDGFGHKFETTDEYYTFDGLRLGMTKDEVIAIWGEPSNKGSFRWTYESRNLKMDNGARVRFSIDFDEKSEDEYFLSSFSANLIEMRTFADQFLMVCNSIGCNETSIINSLGSPDETTTDKDDNTKYLFFNNVDAIVRIPLNLGYADYVISPIQLTNSRIMSGYYNLHGIKLGDNRNYVLQIWGNPTEHGDRVWVYGDRTGTTSNGKRFETHLSFNGDNLEDFEGMMITSNTQSSKSKSGCFVATACYGDYNANEVLILRAYRDNVLMNSFIGRVFVKFYYFISPPLANFIAKSSTLKSLVRIGFLSPIISKIKKNQ